MSYWMVTMMFVMHDAGYGYALFGTRKLLDGMRGHGRLVVMGMEIW